jgi:hypothetical protein
MLYVAITALEVAARGGASVLMAESNWTATVSADSNETSALATLGGGALVPRGFS